MNVPHRILYLVFAGVLATAGSIYAFPEINFVQYVQPMILIGFLSCIVLAATSLYKEEELNLRGKNILMNGFLIAVLVPSLYTAGAFVHSSQTSWSGGEIHWHADFEVLVEQGGELQRLELIDPENFCEETTHESSYMCSINDRVGSTEYHEHNDNRIHVEGVFKDREDASLAAFFDQFKGELTNNKIVYPTNNGTVTKIEDANNSVKILVHKGVGGNRYWCAVGNRAKGENRCSSHGTIASSPQKYVISPYSRGPSLDDIFIIYDSRTVEEALQDVREDGKYRGFGLKKSGEGYGG